MVTNKLTLSDERNGEVDLMSLLQQSEQGIGIVLAMQVSDQSLVLFGQIEVENGVDFGRERRNEGLEAYELT